MLHQTHFANYTPIVLRAEKLDNRQPPEFYITVADESRNESKSSIARGTTPKWNFKSKISNSGNFTIKIFWRYDRREELMGQCNVSVPELLQQQGASKSVPLELQLKNKSSGWVFVQLSADREATPLPVPPVPLVQMRSPTPQNRKDRQAGELNARRMPPHNKPLKQLSVQPSTKKKATVLPQNRKDGQAVEPSAENTSTRPDYAVHIYGGHGGAGGGGGIKGGSGGPGEAPQLTINRANNVLVYNDNAAKQKELLALLTPMDVDASQRPFCLEGTRKNILDQIIYKLTVSSSIVWLHGVAGSGKSTIAASIAQHFLKLKSLGVFIFFTRNQETSPRAVLHRIAFQLALLNEAFRVKLCNNLSDNPGVVNADINTQFQELLKDPVSAAQCHISGSILVVLDALDECDTTGRQTLISLIIKEFPQLYPTICFFITSRRNEDIAAQLDNKDCITQLPLEVLDDQSQVSRDILLYIQYRFENIRERHRISDQNWPGNHSLQALVKSSGSLFIWATIACNLVQEAFDFEAALAKLLMPGSKIGSNLYHLYSVALETSGKWGEKEFADAAQKILSAIVLAKDLLDDTALDKLLNLKLGTSARVLHHLGCVIYWSEGQPAHILHASFADYLVDSEKLHLKPWFVEAAVGHQLLAIGCLDVLCAKLHFNICAVESSYYLNSEIKDLEQCIKQHISFEVAYASKFWAKHLAEIGGEELDNSLHSALNNCFPEYFLYWLEVMSFLRCIDVALVNITIPRRFTHGDLNAFFGEAQEFIRNFGPVIAQSVPHIYLSAVPFLQEDSMLHQTCGRGLQKVLEYQTQWRMDKIFILTAVYNKHTDWVRSVAFSPNRTQIVSGSDDKTIRIWNAATGEAVGTPLEGHTGWVRSVAFSPDGTRIVSGSGDKTIRIWNAATGEAVGTPLEGHTGWVNSVAFSPDGTQIVSGSGDETIHIWNAATGEAVGTPLEGHTGWVNSVAFSPDGTQIVSGSGDKTIRIWNAAIGEAVGTPLERHTDWVNSVAFSPDGTQIVSGSRDKTICIWNAATGEAVGTPLEGHTDSVNSVAFSPDGTQIVSGSRDKTIWIWNAATGEAVGTPLEGHTDSVNSVAFSPDGTQIVSGSGDETIHIWNAATGEAVGTPLEGHTDSVNSVAFSPDGTQIVSGSGDKTICIWNAATGEAVGTPLEGHTDLVNSVAFSPDGTQIVSGSHDKTIRIWNAATEEAVGTPLEQHTGLISSPPLFINWQRYPAFRDGWVCSSPSNRIFWVPPWLRDNFCFPWNSFVITPRGVTKLNLLNFRHGNQWTKCMV
ncbi:WD40 repeat-like protein [Mycena sanguinolenta]|uniref:WD40 repeat-like protein n=1 Tax=Mycena sanguinolenta TaxID=230812 RepID=A0A8H6XGP9_9AGAR|nr:WD40 repeat-like protein [Mycena sanguinolenta]